MHIHILCFSFLLWIAHAGFGQVQPAFPHLQRFDKIRDFTLSQNGKEAYLTIQSPLEEVSVICRMVSRDGKWQKPIPTIFSGKYKDLEPFLSPDNLRLYFASNRPHIPNDPGKGDFDIWFVERPNLKADWGSPQRLGAPINTMHDEFYPAVSKSGHILWTSNRPGGLGKDDLYMSQLEEPESIVHLGDSVNSEGYEFNAYLSPEAEYLIFSGYNRPDGAGSGDMYVSFQLEPNVWTKARNLGVGINSDAMDFCPFVDPKRKLLYFTSRRSSPPPPHPLNTLEKVEEAINAYQNGFSRLYVVPFVAEP